MTDQPMTAAPAPGTPPAGASAWVSVDLDAISDNVAELCRRSGDAEVMAVVKGDAYGHGLVPAARAALRGGATWLGVAQLAEAVELRGAGVTAPLLTWIFAPGADVGAAIDAGIDVTAGSAWTLERRARRRPHPGDRRARSSSRWTPGWPVAGRSARPGTPSSRAWPRRRPREPSRSPASGRTSPGPTHLRIRPCGPSRSGSSRRSPSSSAPGSTPG